MIFLYSPSFRFKGIILGSLIVFFAAALISIEIGRIFTGSINRGRNNSNSSDDFQYLIYPSRISGYNEHDRNIMIENRWVWPWSTATLLFGLIFFLTGVTGIASGQTQSYSGVLTFFICLTISTCLIVFLIATYATIIAGWKSIYNGNLPHYPTIDRNFSIACLAICCLLTILFLISLIASGRFINICTQKFSAPFNYGLVPVRGTPILRPYTPSSMRGTPRVMRRVPQTPSLIRDTPMIMRRGR